MWEVGEKLGLSEEILHVFKHTACEVKLKIKVNTETGYSEIIECNDHKLIKEKSNGNKRVTQ
jgi:hypothetical protein